MHQNVLAQIDALLEEWEAARTASPYDDFSGGLPEYQLQAIATRLSAAISRYAPPGSEYAKHAAAVGGHIGYPWTDEAVAVATKHQNVYIDTSAYTVKRYPPQLVDFMRGHGASKVLFGTNYPMITADKALDGLDTLGLSETAKANFLADNAVRVFKL